MKRKVDFDYMQIDITPVSLLHCDLLFFSSKFGVAEDLWEFVYIKKGSATAIFHDGKRVINEDELFFYKPNREVTIYGKHSSDFEAYVFSFSSSSPFFILLTQKILHLNEDMNYKFQKSIEESIELQSSVMHEKGFEPLKICLEEITRGFLKRALNPTNKDNGGNGNNVDPKKRASAECIMSAKYLVYNIMDMLRNKVYSKLLIDDICTFTYYSRAHIYGVFKETTGMSIMQYFRMLKVDEAKRLIESKEYTFSEISDMLSFENLNYFSRMFKKHTGMTPTDYKNSLPKE